MRRNLFLVALVPLAAFAFFHPAPHAAHPIPETSADSSDLGTVARSRATPGAVVYVAGAVRRPGLYRLSGGARNDDAVRLAGGMLPQADPGAVNLAQPVTDGDEVYVPLAGEASHVGAAPHRRRRGRRTRRPKAGAIEEPSAPVDVNAAPAETLGGVPGIGPAIAERIVAVRGQDGAFTSLDQLLDVAGMTPRRLEQARSYLVINSE